MNKSDVSDFGSQLHIEREISGYINGSSDEERLGRIAKIWKYIQSQVKHFRAPGHHPVSSNRLIQSSQIKSSRSELHIDHKPGRHIIYLDTLSLAFRSASIQVRLEVKQRQRKGVLKDEFTEITIKIGSKEDRRIEEAVRVSLAKWDKDGFSAALKAGMEAEIKRAERKSGKKEAQAIRKKFNIFKDELKNKLDEAEVDKFEILKPYALVHLNRDTIETEYSPYDHNDTIEEIKTDDCEWETAMGKRGQYAQIEIEHIKGDTRLFKRELDGLMGHPEFGITPTTDSKEDAAMVTLETILIAQSDDPDEVQRVEQNRAILADYLKDYEFVSLDPDEIGIVAAPIRAPALSAA